jgi:predicted nucleic acid-binding protein
LAWPDSNETARAYQLLLTYRLTIGVGIPDCLIAAMALSRQARLYTFNLRHYQQIAGLEAQQPYQRG